MDINRFTAKSQEVIRQAQEIALSRSQPQIDVGHLLYALISQEDSIVPIILAKLEANAEKLKGDITDEMDRLPQGHSGGTGQVYVSPDVARILSEAEKEM